METNENFGMAEEIGKSILDRVQNITKNTKIECRYYSTRDQFHMFYVSENHYVFRHIIFDFCKDLVYCKKTVSEYISDFLDHYKRSSKRF